MNYLIGLDAGTTNTKALIMDQEGKQVALALRPSPFITLEDGRPGYDPELLWQNICLLLQDALAQLEAAVSGATKHIAGIAIASMGEMGIPIGKNGPIYPAVAWHDNSSVPQMHRLRQQFTNERMVQITGQRVQHIFTVTKLLWLKENQPKVYDQMETWACIADYIAYRLGGRVLMDYSIASRTCMLDYRKRDWSDEILDFTGISKEKLPELVRSGTLVGSVSAQVSGQTGLMAGTQVFAGGHDHICGALAVGATKPGIFLDSSGTAEVVMTTAPNELRILRNAGEQGFNIGLHTAKDKYYMSGGMPASGASVDWFSREFGLPENDEEIQTGSLIFLPDLRGSESPTRNSNSKGAFLGITTEHTKAHFRQAVYEGLAFQLRLCIDRINGGRPPQKIIAIGGGTKNHRWLQVKSNILCMPIEVPQVQEATAMGAALLAGIGAGIYTDEDDAVNKTYHPGKLVEPDAKNKLEYQRKFCVYRTLYDTLLETNSALTLLGTP